MEKLLIDLQCFANVDYYSLLINFDVLVFEQYEHFQKGSLVNRYYLAGPNGRILLSVPLVHAKRTRVPFRDLEICNLEKWQSLHWKTLCSCYRRSPWFEFYEPELRVMYEKPYRFLRDWNLDAFALIGSWLGRSWNLEWTREYEKTASGDPVSDARGRFVSHPDYAVLEAGTGPYRQVFEDRTGFIPGLSILDMLFCMGKRAAEALESRAADTDADLDRL